jgi:hypothetical protein
MNTGFKRLAILMLLLPALQAESGELLGKISDETAPVAAQPEQAAEHNDRRIIYRVICSPEGEVLPECEQPPVRDTFDAAQPRPAEPEVVEMPDVETPKTQAEQADSIDQSNHAVEPETAKKAAAHKKRTQKSVKKPAKKSAKKTVKPAKRKQR